MLPLISEWSKWCFGVMMTRRTPSAVERHVYELVRPVVGLAGPLLVRAVLVVGHVGPLLDRALYVRPEGHW